MVDLVRLFSSEGKGSKSTYRPEAGTTCLISGPNCDDDSGYVFGEMEILWRDDLFVLCRTPGCWPVINKWDHVIAKPLPTRSPAIVAVDHEGNPVHALPAEKPAEPAMAMLPNDHHPGPRCSCRECLGRYPDETTASPFPHLDTCGLKYGGKSCTCGLHVSETPSP